MLKKTFSATGAEQIFTAPLSGVYTFELTGAAGGKGNAYNTSYGSVPGKGAKLTFSITLNMGDILHICVGRQGTGNTGTANDGASGGGGGGTFIFLERATVEDTRWDITKNSKVMRVLAVAAGGGGTWDESYKGSRGDGKNAIGAAYKSPSNYVAYGTQTNAGTASTSISAVMGISQYISYDLKGSFYTRSGSTGTGGYGGGGSADDDYTYGGGWSGASNVTYSWCFITTAVGVDGVSNGDGYCVITFPALALITDRTSADALRLVELADKINSDGWASLTADEQTEWNAGKGAYNTTDLNRVGSTVAFLTAYLASCGYMVPVTTQKTNWFPGNAVTLPDEFSAADGTVFLANVAALKMTFYGTTALPVTMDYMYPDDANNIEKLLLEIETNISNMVAGFRKSGTRKSGQGVILP